ncbi:hypothetical protein OG735_38855 [Streptomyces sp. NBC_01210]|nr:hypothetical protein OG735_38855 [Streptomyces sp. NBC_01210]
MADDLAMGYSGGQRSSRCGLQPISEDTDVPGGQRGGLVGGQVGERSAGERARRDQVDHGDVLADAAVLSAGGQKFFQGGGDLLLEVDGFGGVDGRAPEQGRTSSSRWWTSSTRKGKGSEAGIPHAAPAVCNPGQGPRTCG